MEERPSLALVTGAARRLGKAIALGLAQEGYAIGLHFNRSKNEAVETAQILRKQDVPVFLLQADLRDPAQITSMFLEVDVTGLDLKVLVNSASIMKKGKVGEISLDAWDETLNTNLRAPLLCSQEAVRRMRDGGVIINLTDTGASKTWTSYSAYAVSKAGLETLTRLCARAFAPAVRVNAVAPGLILPSSDTSPEDWEKLVSKVPARKAGSEQDIVRTVLFLVKNGYITGETVHVDGGYGLV
jgi:pteridine reductase